MNLEEAIRTRRSVRAYAPEAIDRSVIDEIIDLAGQAPSSKNKQPWHFHVATGNTRAKLGETISHTTSFMSEYLATLSPDEWELAVSFFAELGNAPVVIGVSVPRIEDELETINILLATGGALQNLQLAAYDRGLGTCVITFSYWVEEELHEALGVPEDHRIISIVLLGHPATQPEPPERRHEISTFLG